MPSPARRLVFLALFLLPLATGCSTLLTVAYLVQPADMPAEFGGLKGKKVAVVCRPIIELEFTDAGSARELATLVGSQIEQNVRGSEVVGQHEVARWIDENAWTDYQSVGDALATATSWESISKSSDSTRARRSIVAEPRFTVRFSISPKRSSYSRSGLTTSPFRPTTPSRRRPLRDGVSCCFSRCSRNESPDCSTPTRAAKSLRKRA